MTSTLDPLTAFIEAATPPRRVGHTDGTIEEANAILAVHPEIATATIATAALLGDATTVQRFLAADAVQATAKSGSRGWDPLTYLCFSRYLRLERSRSEAFVQTAMALLDAGADPNTGWIESNHQPKPEWESAIYGAAGVAHHAGVTRLLLERGADPNDDETPYHAPETYDNAAMRVLVESGRLNADSMVMMLLRKADWHDGDGLRYLLEHGAEPNRITRWGYTALHQSLRRDNSLEAIVVQLDHGADARLANRADGRSAVELAVHRGRRDVLAELERRGVPLPTDGVDGLIAACARDDAQAIRALTTQDASLVGRVRAMGATLLTEFAATANADGVVRLLDLGVDVDARYDGDGYWDVAPDSTALQMAAWKAWHSTVKRLIERGASVNAVDSRGRTALQLAVRACVASYWTDRRSPESVDALLAAGASARGITLPTGYDDVDALLRPHVDTAHQA